MKPMSISQIAKAVGNTQLHFAQNQTKITSISTDSRSQADDADAENCLFIALRGENFDGHHYVESALQLKAAYALVDKKGIESANLSQEMREDPRLIYCNNTEQGFLDIAGAYRNQFNFITVGITGSVGKTTTKEMIAQVLSAKFNTLKTQGNFNNRVGLPKTLLNLDDDTEAAVIEMGMSSFGEISDLSRRAKPDLAVITNIGVSHIEYLGSKEGILKAKLEILDGMKKGSTLILCSDDEMLRNVKNKDFKIITYGTKHENSTVKGEEIIESGGKTEFKIRFDGNSYYAKIPTFGLHNVNNALAAFAVGIEFKMQPLEIAAALENYKPSGMRQKVVQHNEICVVEDCYNAGPDSMQAAIHTFGSMTKEGKFANGRKILVMGDMLELGELAQKAHYEIGKCAARENLDVIYCCGPLSIAASQGALESLEDESKTLVRYFDDKKALTEALLSSVRAGDILWFKASRGMKLEEVISRIYERF